jgi:hypothetical protein
MTGLVLSNHRSQVAFDVEQALNGLSPKFIRARFSPCIYGVLLIHRSGTSCLRATAIEGIALITFIIMAVMGLAPY